MSLRCIFDVCKNLNKFDANLVSDLSYSLQLQCETCHQSTCKFTSCSDHNHALCEQVPLNDKCQQLNAPLVYHFSMILINKNYYFLQEKNIHLKGFFSNSERVGNNNKIHGKQFIGTNQSNIDKKLISGNHSNIKRSIVGFLQSIS